MNYTTLKKLNKLIWMRVSPLHQMKTWVWSCWNAMRLSWDTLTCAVPCCGSFTQVRPFSQGQEHNSKQAEELQLHLHLPQHSFTGLNSTPQDSGVMRGIDWGWKWEMTGLHGPSACRFQIQNRCVSCYLQTYSVVLNNLKGTISDNIF